MAAEPPPHKLRKHPNLKRPISSACTGEMGRFELQSRPSGGVGILLPQPGGQVISRPDRTWKWRWGTDWPACFSQWGRPHWVPFLFKCSAELNSACAILTRLGRLRIYGAKAPPHLRWGPRRAGLLSPEARSYPGRTGRGNAGGAHSAPPAGRCWTPPGSCPAPAPWLPWR